MALSVQPPKPRCRASRESSTRECERVKTAWRPLAKALKAANRPKLLERVYADPRWLNLRRLISHSTAAIERRRERDTTRYAAMTPEDREARTAAQRRRRQKAWLELHRDELLEAIRRFGLGGVQPYCFARVVQRFGDEALAVYTYLQLLVAIESDAPQLDLLHERLAKLWPQNSLADRSRVDRLVEERREQRLGEAH